MEIGQAFHDTLVSAGILPCRRALEVGCGSGLAAAYIRHSAGELCLSDISGEAIRQVCERFDKIKNIRIVQKDIYGISGTVDLIYYFLSFHHIDNPTGQLERIRSLLAHDGNLVICEFYSLEGKRFHIRDKVFRDTYAPVDLRRLLVEAGFVINVQKEIGAIHHNGSPFLIYLLQASLP